MARPNRFLRWPAVFRRTIFLLGNGSYYVVRRSRRPELGQVELRKVRTDPILEPPARTWIFRQPISSPRWRGRKL